jgi:phenylacetate-CoA ligase
MPGLSIARPPAEVVVTRDELPDLWAGAGSAAGWLACSPDGMVTVPLCLAELAELRDLTAEALACVGITRRDRVLVALNSDGAGVGVAWSEAASLVGGAACGIGPRAGPRLAAVLRMVGASTLVCTPSTARSLLVQTRRGAGRPADLGLDRLVLTGELVPDRAVRELAQGFAVRVDEVWCDPIFGAGLAFRPPGGASLAPVRPGVIELLPVRPRRAGRHGPLVEWTLAPSWCAALGGARIRTGLVGRASHGPGLPPARWTVGDHLLLRGRWISVRAIAAAVGPVGWTLVVERGLVHDQARLLVPRDAGVPVAAVRAALGGVSPVHIPVEPVACLPAAAVVDRRGRHLGQRAAVESGSPAARRRP